MKDFRYKLWLIAFCVGLVFESRIKNSKLFHRNTTLDKVIHVLSHWERLHFVIVIMEILEIDFIPFWSRNDNTSNCKYAVGNIENMIITF